MTNRSAPRQASAGGWLLLLLGIGIALAGSMSTIRDYLREGRTGQSTAYLLVAITVDLAVAIGIGAVFAVPGARMIRGSTGGRTARGEHGAYVPPPVLSDGEAESCDPGWYPDPDVSGRKRWFDGTRWTDHTDPPVSTFDGVGPSPRMSPPPVEPDSVAMGESQAPRDAPTDVRSSWRADTLPRIAVGVGIILIALSIFPALFPWITAAAALFAAGLLLAALRNSGFYRVALALALIGALVSGGDWWIRNRELDHLTAATEQSEAALERWIWDRDQAWRDFEDGFSSFETLIDQISSASFEALVELRVASDEIEDVMVLPWHPSIETARSAIQAHNEAWAQHLEAWYVARPTDELFPRTPPEISSTFRIAGSDFRSAIPPMALHSLEDHIEEIFAE